MFERLLCLPALALLLALSLPAPAQPLPEPAVRLEKALRAVRTLEADFDQTYYSATVAQPLHEKGRFYFEKPALMRWEYAPPDPKVFIYKDGVFSQYYPEDEQLIRSSLAKAQYESEVLSLLSGQKDLAADYEVALDVSTPEARAAGRLKLTPRTEGQYAWITLDPDPGTGLIKRAVFQDWAENRTEYIFSHIKENQPLKASLFTLVVPPGTEIIEDEGPGAAPLKKKAPDGPLSAPGARRTELNHSPHFPYK
jgi:outer membrane lipoprotein carrier protein